MIREPEDQAISCKILSSSILCRKVSPMKFQQYGHLNKTCVMTAPTDIQISQEITQRWKRENQKSVRRSPLIGYEIPNGHLSMCQVVYMYMQQCISICVCVTTIITEEVMTLIGGRREHGTSGRQVAMIWIQYSTIKFSRSLKMFYKIRLWKNCHWINSETDTPLTVLWHLKKIN